MRFKLPFAIFIVLAIVLAFGLTRDPKVLPSALIDKPAPAIDLPLLHDSQQTFKVESLRGQVVAAERVGVVVRAVPRRVAGADGTRRQGRRGDLWAQLQGQERRGAHSGCSATAIPIAARPWTVDGRIGIDYGVYGVPETFVIDRRGPHSLQACGPDHAPTSGRRACCRWCGACNESLVCSDVVRMRCAVWLRQAPSRKGKRIFRPACAAWCARTRPWPNRMRRWPPTCASRSASSSPRARASSRSRDYFEQRYGVFVRYDPPFMASTWLLWLGPFVLLVVGLWRCGVWCCGATATSSRRDAGRAGARRVAR